MPDGADDIPDRTDAGWRVGSWQVEPALNRISRADRTVRLEPKTMALLCCLGRRPGQVIAREALLAAVWPGVIVGDDSLTQAVIKLRKALGDSAEAPSYIETIAKGGYRLVAHVEPMVPRSEAGTRGGSAGTDDNAALQAGAPPAGAVRRRRFRVAVAVGAMLALALGGIWWASTLRPLVETGTVASGAPSASRTSQPAVRIAPFQPIGDDAQATLLAQGMTADLTTDLSKVSDLAVVADTAVPPRSNGNGPVDASGADYVVSGSVQRLHDRLRLYVFLAEARSGKQLWTQRFDRATSDLFALQDEIVPKLLQVLPAKVSEAELRRLAHRYTHNLQAYELYQRGRAALITRERDENAHARELFRRALELDPSFALAYAALAQTYAADHRNQWGERDAQHADALQRAWELAQTAHELDPDLRETYWVLAFVHLERGEHEQALAQLETVLRLYPSFADAYAFLGGIYAYLGEPARTLPLMRTAMRLNPDAGYLYYLILGRAYFALGDMAQARIHLERALARNPVNVETRVYAAAVYAAAGDPAQARWQAQEIRTIQPDFSLRSWLATHPLRDAATRSRLVQELNGLPL